MPIRNFIILTLLSLTFSKVTSAQELEVEYRHKTGPNLSECNCKFMEIGDTVFMRIYILESQMYHKFFRLSFVKDSIEEFSSEVIPNTAFVKAEDGRYYFERLILRRTSETVVARPTKICLYEQSYLMNIKLEGFSTKKKAKVKRFEKKESRPDVVLNSGNVKVKVNEKRAPNKKHAQKTLGLTSGIVIGVVGLFILLLSI